MNPQLKLKLAMAFSWAFHAVCGAATGAEVVEYQFPQATVWAISDRQLTVPTAGQESLLTNISAEELRAARGEPPRTSGVYFNVYLVKTRDRLSLIDTGFGEAGGGKLLAHLAALNIEPAQITDIYLTHLHGDHCGGLLRDGRAAFPNATLHLTAEEYAYWTEPQTPNNGVAVAALLPMKTKLALIKLTGAGFERDDSLGDFSARALFGHTPGHAAFGLALDESRTLIFAGDFMHQIAIQAARPQTSIQYDVDPQAAIAAREKFLAEITAASDTAYVVAGAHLPFPGLFTFTRQTGGGYGYHPVTPENIAETFAPRRK